MFVPLPWSYIVFTLVLENWLGLCPKFYQHLNTSHSCSSEPFLAVGTKWWHLLACLPAYDSVLLPCPICTHQAMPWTRWSGDFITVSSVLYPHPSYSTTLDGLNPNYCGSFDSFVWLDQCGLYSFVFLWQTILKNLMSRTEPMPWNKCRALLIICNCASFKQSMASTAKSWFLLSCASQLPWQQPPLYYFKHRQGGKEGMLKLKQSLYSIQG